MAEVQKTTQAGEMTQVFIEFVMMQSQNAAMFLGQMPDPRTGRGEVNLPLAKMFIDQLAVIQKKTAGNLAADEAKVIKSAVTQLQMAFAEVAQMVKAQNLGAEIPQPLFAGELKDEVFEDDDELEAPAAIAPPESKPVEPAPKAAEPVPKAPESTISSEPPQEESRKRFTKSYGS